MSPVNFFLFPISLIALTLTVTSLDVYALSNTSSLASRVHSGNDLSPVMAVIAINSDMTNGSSFFTPYSTSIRAIDEILIINNSTSDQDVTSGTGPQDPKSGTNFNTGIISPGKFTEYVPYNLNPGTYSYYSSQNPQMKGEIIITQR